MGTQLLMSTLASPYSQETAGEVVVLEKFLELVIDKCRQARPGLGLDMREEGFEPFPHRLTFARSVLSTVKNESETLVPV